MHRKGVNIKKKNEKQFVKNVVCGLQSGHITNILILTPFDGVITLSTDLIKSFTMLLDFYTRLIK